MTRNPRDDPSVQDALRERPPDDIMLLCCPRCNAYGYWNQGSHFSCSVPGCDYTAIDEEFDNLIEGEIVSLDEFEDMQKWWWDYP